MTATSRGAVPGCAAAGYREGGIPGGCQEGYTGYSPTGHGYGPPLNVQPPPSPWAGFLGLPWEVLGRVPGGVRGGVTAVGASRWRQEADTAPTAGRPRVHAPRTQYRRDSGIYILKLVLNPECHRKSSMRPGILPISKTRPEITTLNFQDFYIPPPSLPRNKWSRF